MFKVLEDERMVERAFLVGVRTPQLSQTAAQDHLDELRQLVDTMGVPVVGSALVPVQRFSAALLIGRGKAEEIVAECEALEADCLIFDEDLSPSQQRNWEKLNNICVIDRREVILDIFANHARSREARLQVALARQEYSLPRLRRAWTHLERQRGGTGMRGAGEMQLETDQRLVRDKIHQIKKQLSTLRKQRATQRKKRRTKPVPVAAIVGYTNAGKSSLLKHLTNADIDCEDKLFATLDPTARRLILPNNQEILLSDTVGFIRKLPHDLVASFRATLEEAAVADFLIHIVDASHANAREQIDVTRTVLKELDIGDKPAILALNKVDLVPDRDRLSLLDDGQDQMVRVSAATGEGTDSLLELLSDMLAQEMETLVLEIPQSRYDVVALAHREGLVKREAHENNTVWLEVDLPRRIHGKVEEFIAPALPEKLARGN